MPPRRFLLPLFVLVLLAALPAQAAVAQGPNQAPTACFTVTPSAPTTGDTVTFNSACSTDSDGTIASRAWDTDNDGVFDNGTAPSITTMYRRAGSYTVRLQVTDNRGATAVTTQTFTVANRAPSADFDWSPAAPPTGQAVTFTSRSTDSDGTIAAYRWALDADGVFDDGTTASVKRTYATPGTYSAKLEVTDNSGAVSVVTKSVTVSNRGPAACFNPSPTSPTTGQETTLNSACSTDPDGGGAQPSRAWDLDNDGQYDDSTAVAPTTSWARTGNYVVKLRVTDALGATSFVQKTITVTNRAPVAGFISAPEKPVAGDTVTFTSTASDPDGSIAAQAWDLDNDGQYDDATGATASWKPAAAGAYTIALRVTDDKGAVTVAARTIIVGDPPPPPNEPAPREPAPRDFDVSTPVLPPPVSPGPAPVAPLRLLDPFPVVRMRGRTTKRGARLTLFSVRAPHGSTVAVVCKGRRCPSKPFVRKVATKRQTGGRTVRFRRLERFHPAGVALQVTVARPGMVGKYTRIRIRRLKLPVRVDRCLLPTSFAPAACPAGS